MMPVTPNLNAGISHASKLVVTASRAIALQPAQIETAAMPGSALQVIGKRPPRHQFGRAVHTVSGFDIDDL